MIISEEYSIAVHEAGHALMAIITGKKLNYVTIIPNGVSLGECNSNFKENILNNASNESLNFKMDMTSLDCLAGITAERVILGIEPEKCSKHGQIDTLTMGALVSNAFHNDITEENNYIEFMTKSVFNIIQSPLAQCQIKAIANALIEKKTLSGEQVKKIMELTKQQLD